MVLKFGTSYTPHNVLADTVRRRRYELSLICLESDYAIRRRVYKKKSEEDSGQTIHMYIIHRTQKSNNGKVYSKGLLINQKKSKTNAQTNPLSANFLGTSTVLARRYSQAFLPRVS
jgi:hypothetical protein